jgi:TolA-binding protein
MIQFNQLLQYLQSEMATCGDTSFSTTNQNIPQTIQQIIDLEGKDFERELHRDQQQRVQTATAVGIAEQEETVDGFADRVRSLEQELQQQTMMTIDEEVARGIDHQEQEQETRRPSSSRRDGSCIIS